MGAMAMQFSKAKGAMSGQSGARATVHAKMYPLFT